MQQQLRPRQDAFVQAVYRCKSWQQLRAVLEQQRMQQQQQDQKQLQPWRLLAALRHLSGITNSSPAPSSSSSSNSQLQRQQPQSGQAEEFGISLVQCLLQHPGLWSPAAPGLGCGLYPHETKALLLAVSGLSLKLPFSSNDQLQALYEDAVQHGICAAESQQQQDGDEQQQPQQVGWVLSADQQVQLLGGCLTLGLKPLQQHLEVLGALQPSSVADFSLLGAALLLFAADALLANRMLGNPAAAARAAGSLPPSQVAIGEVPLPLLAAALQRLAAAGSWQLNRNMGARRIRQLVLLPLSRLASHRHLQLTVVAQQQLQQRQQEDAEPQDSTSSSDTVSDSDDDRKAETSGMPGLVQEVCTAVQRAIGDGLYAQHQKEQQQQQQQPTRGGRGSSSTARRPSRGNSAGRPAPTGGWSVVTAAAALLLMRGQLGCLITPRCLPVLTAAAAAELTSLPDHLLLPLVQLVAASAAESREEQQQQSADSQAGKQQQQRRGYGRWRSAVLVHLGNVGSSRLRVDQLLGCVVALAQHHGQEEAQQGSSSSSAYNSSDTFLEECSRVLDAAVAHHVQAAEGVLKQQQLQQQQRQLQPAAMLPYSSQQLALLLPQLQQVGVQPSSATATGLLQLILVAPRLQQQAAAGRSGGVWPQQQQQQQQQQGSGQPAVAQPADLAAACTAASQLRNAPDQQVMQQLAQAMQLAGQQVTATGKPVATWSSAASSSSSTAAGAPGATRASEACALICSLAPPVIEEDEHAAIAAAPPPSSSSNRAKLGDYAFAVYQGIGQLQGSQLAALVAALAALRVSLAEPLGPRSLDGKAKVTYGRVLAAAASAAAAPATLAATPPDAVAQLAAGVAGLGGRPDAAWWAAVQQRLAGQLGAVSGPRLQQLLGALLGCGVRPGQAWLQEACQVSSRGVAGTAPPRVVAGDREVRSDLRRQC
jgi:hypothetical protein